MTEIVRGDDLKYVLAYNDFHYLESSGINGKTEKPIQYTYKKRQQIDYGWIAQATEFASL